MRYFIDCEFSERGPRYPLEIISIGVVAEDGREFYACNLDFNRSHANAWVAANVLPLLPDSLAKTGDGPWLPLRAIGPALLAFIGSDRPEFWGYYCAYDWVVTCQLFGDMSKLPPNFPMYCNDLRAWLDMYGYDDVKQPDDAPHDALADARWIARTHEAFAWAGVEP